MAINAPTCIDVLEFQFKIHQKITIFNAAENLRNNVNLLATSSNYGLIFVGDPYKSEFRVLKHQNIVDGEPLEARNVLIPGLPNNIAVSCDGLLLAVSYSLRNSDFLSIFSVPSFLTTNIETLFNIRLHPENNVNVTQILWNPVISATLAVILNNGAVGMYNLKDTSYEFHSLNKSEQAKCACWSPKGKQIVIGFPDGKLVQYKPDLKPAKTIICPPNIYQKPFDTIAVHWLSTYQFAVVFQEKHEDTQPCVFILNAPKVGNQTYINYYDVCYSGSGPRQSQINFIHIQSWNILLMSSANSVEIGILGTKELGETPMWQQYITPDEARIELPLTNDKQETFPIGFSLDTGCVHQLTIGETKIPVMPIIHLLSTHGMLVSFNFLNLTPNAPGICSPPDPISDVSNCFKSIDEILEQRENASNVSQPLSDANKANQQMPDMSFSLSSNATSTPTIDRKGNSESSTLLGNNSALSKPLFGTVNVAPTTKPLGTDNFSFSGIQKQQMNQPQPMSANLFGGQSFGQKSIFGGGVNLQQQTETFGNLNLSQANTTNQQQGLAFGTQLKEGNQLTFGQPTGQNKLLSFQTPQPSSEQQQMLSNKQQTIQKVDDAGKMKPLYTISPNFTPSQLQQQQQHQMLLQSKQQIQNVQDIATAKSTKSQSDELDLNSIIKQMITTQIDAFEKELCILSVKTENLNVSPDEIEETKTYTKRLNDLKELNDRAKDGSIEMDIQVLRHSLNECLKMVCEAKSKLNMYKNPQLSQLSPMSNVNQSSRRQLAKLNQIVATNEVQLNIVNQLIDSQWSNYQDLVRQNSNKNKYMPNLEAIYQTLVRQKDIVARGRMKLNYFKSKLGIKGLLDNNKKVEQDVDVNSLADSILSMGLAEQVSKENSRLTYEKNKLIRESLRNHQIIKIKPQRPNRIGLNSEVILESRERTIKDRDGAVTKPEKMEKERVKDEQQQRTLTKPTPTKAVSILNTNQTQQPKKEQQKIPQVKEVQFTAAAQNTPVFPSIGSSFIKPEFSQPTMNIFGSGTTSNQNSIFVGGNKTLEQSKPNFGSLNATTIQNDSSSIGVKNTTFAFSPAIDVNQKESVAVSFAPKIIENDQQSLGTGFITIQGENKPTGADMTKESSASTVANANKQTPIITTNQSLFSPLGIGSLSPENKSFSSGTGFSMLSVKDTKMNQNSSISNLSQNVPLSSSNSLSFKAFSLPKPESESTKNQELPSPQNSTSISSENFTSPKPAIESFSFNLTSKTSTTTPAATTSPLTSGFSFGNVPMPKPTVVTTITPTSSVVNTTVTSVFSNTSTGTSLSSNLSPTSNTATASQSTISFGSVPIPSTLSTSTTPSIAAPTDLSVKNTSNNEQINLFEGLSICKPTALENATSTSSTTSTTITPASATTAATTETKSLFDSIATTTTSSNGLNFGSVISSAAPAFGGISSPNSSGSLFGGTAVSSSPSLFGNTSSSAIATPLFGSVVCTSTSTFSSPTSSTSTSAPAFGSPTASTSTSAPAFGSSTSSTSTSAFGSFTSSTATSVFGSAVATTTASLFGSPTSTSTTASLFGSPTSTSTSSMLGFTTLTTSTSIFGGTTSTISPISTFGNTTTTTSPSGLFAGVTKPVQSVFGGSGVTNFPASNSTSVFGGQTSNQPVSNASNIFGGGSTPTSGFGMMTNAPSAFGTNVNSQSTSPFGAPVNTTTSVFGSPKSETTTNLFGTVSQSSPTSGGSLFGGSFGNTGQTTGSVFGGSGLPQSIGFGSAFAQPQTSQPFGATTPQQQSLFGGATSNTSAFGQNTFGGGSSSFGQTTGGFGSTSAMGTFAQGGPSVAQTGFGSPTGFAPKSAFGGSSTFGGSPSFGSPPTFGGTATFGSPKPGFGTFGTTNAVGGAFSPASQKNNLFESLGSTDTGLSFGNLAQNANANADKPQFGGSSFSSWR